MKNKIFNIFLLIFCFLFLIYPVSYIFNDLKFIICFSIIYVVLFYLIKKICKKIDEKYYLLIVILLAIFTRFLAAIFLNYKVVQVSDFGGALNSAISFNFDGAYHQVFTHWNFYPALMHFIFNIFGSSQLVALIVNAIILVLNSVLIYFIADIIYGKKKYGLLASLIYVFWPANILYVSIFTQEHLGALCFLIVIYIMIKIIKNEICFGTSRYFTYIIVGTILGFSTFLKNFAPVILIALIIFYIMYFLKQKINKKILVTIFVELLVILSSFSLSKNLLYKFNDYLVGKPVARNITPCYLLVGLHSSGNGLYNSNLYSLYYKSLEQTNYNYDETNKYVMNVLKDDLEFNKKLLSKLNFKAEIIFKNDSARLNWVKESIFAKNEDRVGYYIENIVKPINNFYYYSVMFLLTVGLIFMYKKKNLYSFLLYLIIFGSGLLLLLIEAQNRYMYSLQTFYCILAVGGVITINNYLRKKGKNGIFKINED